MIYNQNLKDQYTENKIHDNLHSVFDLPSKFSKDNRVHNCHYARILYMRYLHIILLLDSNVIHLHINLYILH